MSLIHQNYNLRFINNTVTFANPADSTYIPLFFYMAQIEDTSYITEVLPDIDQVISGEVFHDGIAIGSEVIHLTQDTAEIKDLGGMCTMTTIDFKCILEEYREYLRTPPMSAMEYLNY